MIQFYIKDKLLFTCTFLTQERRIVMTYSEELYNFFKSKTQPQLVASIDSHLNSLIDIFNELHNIIAKEFPSLYLTNNEEQAIKYFKLRKEIEDIVFFLNEMSLKTLEQTEDNNDAIEIIDLDNIKNVYVFVCANNYCPNCQKELIPYTVYYRKLSNNKWYSSSVKWYRCSECGKFFVDDMSAMKFDTSNTNVEFNTEFYHKITLHDVIVLSNINQCSSKNHDVKDYVASIGIIQADGSTVLKNIPISYCSNCERYIMLKADYDALGGSPVCTLIDESKNIDTDDKNNEFNFGDTKGSKLTQYGYNVNCIEKLTHKQRQSILDNLIYSGTMSVGEISSILQSLINNGSKREGSKKDWSNAINKWQSDLKYINEQSEQTSLPSIDIDRLILKFTTQQKSKDF